MTRLKTATLLVATALFAGSTMPASAQPNPILYLTSVEPYSVNGQNFMRYRYDVFNKDQYPAAMFAPAPALPPGFCALGTPTNLGQIWFSLPEGQIPPSYVYIEITDRQTNTKYRSNLADTVL